MDKKRQINKKIAIRIVENICYPILALGIIFAIWAIVAKVKDNALVFPMPSVVLERFFTLGSEEGFWISVGYSLYRTIVCFAISFVLAMLFAVLGGLFKPLHKVMSPVVSVLRSAPTVAVILIMYALLGVGKSNIMAIFVGFLIAFPVMYSAFYSAIIGVDKDLIEMAKVYKMRHVDVVRGIYIPSIAQSVFDVSQSTVSLTLKVVVASEILTSVSKSIGEKIATANAIGEFAYLFAYTLIAIVFSFVLEGIVSLFRKLWEVLK